MTDQHTSSDKFETAERGAGRTMRLHVHSGQDGTVHTIADAPADSPVANHLDLPAGAHVFAVDDTGRELDASERLADAFGEGTGRVVTHPGRQITVEVHYAGATATLTVSPGVRLAVIREQTITQLSIDPASAADLGLRLPAGTEDLPLDKPIASIAKGADRVDLELIAMIRPQG